MNSWNAFDEEIHRDGVEADALDLESVRGALDELFLLARHYRNSDKFNELLQFVANFRRYSAYNAMLVHIQMPGAKYVLPAKRWHDKYGRLPVPNAQPLVMLQPRGPVMFGFDVSQTEGRPLPSGFGDPFETRGRLRSGEFDLMIANAQGDGVLVERRSLGSTLGGYVRNADNPYHCIGMGQVKASCPAMRLNGKEIPIFAALTLNANLSDETNFATLTHELGHLYCGHLGTPNPKWWPDRQFLDRNREEFEAESVSYLVCQRAGIETPAAEYLHGYLNANEEIPNISLEVIFKAVQRIESMRGKKLKSRVLDTQDG